MQQCKWSATRVNLKTVEKKKCWGKETWHRRAYTVWFHWCAAQKQSYVIQYQDGGYPCPGIVMRREQEGDFWVLVTLCFEICVLVRSTHALRKSSTDATFLRMSPLNQRLEVSSLSLLFTLQPFHAKGQSCFRKRNHWSPVGVCVIFFISKMKNMR